MKPVSSLMFHQNQSSRLCVPVPLVRKLQTVQSCMKPSVNLQQEQQKSFEVEDQLAHADEEMVFCWIYICSRSL